MEYTPRSSTDHVEMLRTSGHNRKISAHVIMEVNFDFNRTPLAPTGNNIIFNEKTNRSHTWDHNGVQGWYTGLEVEQ